MRRIIPLVTALSFLTVACTKAPEPEKAKNLDNIQSKDGKEKSKLGSELDPIPEGAVAKVGGTEITNAAFRAIYDLKLRKYEDRDRKIPKTADRRYRKSITERLVYQEVLRQEMAARGLKFDEAKLKEREEAQRRGIPDWDKHLRRRGESDESLRQIIIAELSERAILGADGKLAVTDEEVDAEYEKVKPSYKKDKERVRASHILVKVGPGPKGKPAKPEDQKEGDKAKWEKEALAKANEVFEKVKAKDADFSALARELSDGPSARKGGDLGIFTADRMVKEFSDAAFGLKVGQVSKPVKTKFGFHIIKVFGKYGPGDLPKEALADQLKERLGQRKLHQGRRDLKKSLLEKFEVVNEMEKTLGPDPRKRSRTGAATTSKGPAVAKKAEAKPAGDKAAEATPTEAKADGGGGAAK